MVKPEKLENLIASFDSLDINIQNEMAQINYTLFRIELDSIPTFDGEGSGINLFINACERICNKYSQNADVKDIIFQTILSKLRDRAKTLICSRNELNTWVLVKDAIYSYFGDKRDFGQLVQEFNNTRMMQREDPISFGHRLQDLLSQLMTKLSQSTSVTHKVARAEIYAQTALEVYLLNLPEEIQVHVKPLQPNSLEEAIGLARDAVNFRTRSNIFRGVKSNPIQQQKKPIQSTRYYQSNIAPNYMPSQSYRYPNYNQSQFNTPSPQPAFPRGPIQIVPKPVAQQPKPNFPTNKQVFGPQRNVFAPGQSKTPTPLYTPTPMSGISTTMTKPPIQQNQFGRPQLMTAEELHNDEIQQETQEVQPMYNPENGLWYIPVDTPGSYEGYQEEATPSPETQDEIENFQILASQENSIG